jgi:hypothetical protein
MAWMCFVAASYRSKVQSLARRVCTESGDFNLPDILQMEVVNPNLSHREQMSFWHP